MFAVLSSADVMLGVVMVVMVVMVVAMVELLELLEVMVVEGMRLVKRAEPFSWSVRLIRVVSLSPALSVFTSGLTGLGSSAESWGECLGFSLGLSGEKYEEL